MMQTRGQNDRSTCHLGVHLVQELQTWDPKVSSPHNAWLVVLIAAQEPYHSFENIPKDQRAIKGKDA